MTKPQETGYYRCAVHEDHAEAVLRSRRRRLDALVQEISIDGFTVLLRQQDVARLVMGQPWILEYGGSTVEVDSQWFRYSPEGRVQIGLRQVRDLTKPDTASGSVFSRRKSAVRHELGYSGLLYSGLLLFVFLILAMPGIGDALGTAAKIESAVLSLWQGLGDMVRGLR